MSTGVRRQICEVIKMRFDSGSILISTAVMVVGFILLPIFDDSISGRETFFKIFALVVIGFLVFAVSSAIKSRRSNNKDS